MGFFCDISVALADVSTWDEIDFATATWVVPASRMKSGREHRVPLSDRAVEILRALPRDHFARAERYIFPGAKEGWPCSKWSEAPPVKHDADLVLSRKMPPRRPAHILHGLFRRISNRNGFLSHLRSL